MLLLEVLSTSFLEFDDNFSGLGDGLGGYLFGDIPRCILWTKCGKEIKDFSYIPPVDRPYLICRGY